MKKIFLMTLLLGSMMILWTGCEKEPSSSTPTITLDKGTYSQLEVALLSSTGITIQENLYNGTISNEAVSLVKVQGSLAFIVPEVSAGAHKLQVTIDGQNLEVTINVSMAVIVGNPVTYLDSKIESMTYTTVELDSLISSSIGMLGSSADAQNKAIIETYFNDYQMNFAALTTSEKQQVANFVRANESLFVPLDDVLGILDTTNIHRFGNVFTQKLEHAVQNITVSKLKLVALVVITALTIESCAAIPTPWTCGAAAITTVALIYKLYQHNKTIACYLDKVFAPFSVALEDMNLKNFILTKDETYEMRIDVNRRTLYNTDMSSSNTKVQNLIAELNESKSTWDEIMTFVPTALSGTSNHFENETAFNSTPIEEGNTYLSINNISNQNVIISAQTVVNNKLQVVFTTTETTTQNFTFDVNYDDGEFQLSSTVNATLNVPAPFSYQGIWILNTYDLDNGGNLHQSDRITFDSSGNSTFYEKNIWASQLGWQVSSVTWDLSYSTGLLRLRHNGASFNYDFLGVSPSDSVFIKTTPGYTRNELRRQ